MPPAKLRGPLHDDLLRDARARLFERLATEGVAGLFGPDPRPLSNALIAQLCGATESMVKRSIAARDRARARTAEPAGAP